MFFLLFRKNPDVFGCLFYSFQLIFCGSFVSILNFYTGYFYLVYAGKNEERADEFRGLASRRPWPRGWNKLGLARSRDLAHWYPAGMKG